VATKYRLDIEYDGTDFSGWQFQLNMRTVQGCLESELTRLFGEKITAIGASRTDAGVHAAGQVVNFESHLERPPKVIIEALNALLPADIRVTAAGFAQTDFHARYDALWRAYRYRIALHPIALGRMYSWHCPHELNIKPMQSAVSYIQGEHVLRSFAHDSDKEKHYLSYVYRADWIQTYPYLEFHITANRFLHGMVRLLVGTFVDIGRGKKSPSELKKILDSQDVRLAGPKAPAAGLTLLRTSYEPWGPVETTTETPS